MVFLFWECGILGFSFYYSKIYWNVVLCLQGFSLCINNKSPNISDNWYWSNMIRYTSISISLQSIKAWCNFLFTNFTVLINIITFIRNQNPEIIVNNAININKISNCFSPQITEHKERPRQLKLKNQVLAWEWHKICICIYIYIIV